MTWLRRLCSRSRRIRKAVRRIFFSEKQEAEEYFFFSVFLWDKPIFHAGFRHMNEEIIADMFCAAARYGTETYSSTLKEDAFL